MTTSELLSRVEKRLNGDGNAPLPPEETLRAVIELGNKMQTAMQEAEKKDDQIAELKGKLESALSRMDDAEYEAKTAKDKAKEQEWIAHELGKFISDVANSLYVGQEIAAANRVYDLNKGSLKKKRLNAYNFDSLDEAKETYHKYCLKKCMTYNEIEMLGWLFEYAERP